MERKFLQQLLEDIKEKDSLHYKRIKSHIEYAQSHHKKQFEEISGLIFYYCNSMQITPSTLSDNYLRMIRDMRVEGIYFAKHGKYSCQSATEANRKVYSNEEVMSYYMHALLISQVLWKHHFDIFVYMKDKLECWFVAQNNLKILDVGPGHGFFSHIVKNTYPKYECLDIVDISHQSLNMTRKIIGEEKRIHYYEADIFDFYPEHKYDLIILGEVLEHLENPHLILLKLSKLLTDNGVIWITTPTNSPALDHIYLFRTRQEVVDVIEQSALKVIDSSSFCAEDMDEETADEKKVTNIVVAICKKKNDEVSRN